MAPSVADAIAETFSGLTGEIIKNHLKNLGRKKTGVRHSDEVKKFALTLHFYSPRAYEYFRKHFSAPCPRSLQVWTSSVKCEPGFFEDVFEHLKNMVAQDKIRNEDVALIFDSMAIRQSTVYDYSKGAMDGFVNLGEGLVGCSEDTEMMKMRLQKRD